MSISRGGLVVHAAKKVLGYIRLININLTAGPVAYNVTPDYGSTAGGTAISINGANLTGANSVTLGGVACTSVIVVNSYTITAVTGARAQGSTTLVVTTPLGTATLLNAFSYEVAPTNLPPYFEFLMVGGGGAGGNTASGFISSSGGGGGGGFRFGTISVIKGLFYYTAIGVGGARDGDSSHQGQSGGNTSILYGNQHIEVIGGGGGGGGAGTSIEPEAIPYGAQGGSSGGSVGLSQANGGTGGYFAFAPTNANQGTSGGVGFSSSPFGIFQTISGGGGGAGTAGISATGGVVGTGGDGKSSSISGTLEYYAAGGGGGARGVSTVALGGLGGGGDGASSAEGVRMHGGDSNCIGGGGGGAQSSVIGSYAMGGSGSPGTIIFRYLSSYDLPQYSEDDITYTLIGGYHIFTAYQNGVFSFT